MIGIGIGIMIGIGIGIMIGIGIGIGIMIGIIKKCRKKYCLIYLCRFVNE